MNFVVYWLNFSNLSYKQKTPFFKSSLKRFITRDNGTMLSLWGINLAETCPRAVHRIEHRSIAQSAPTQRPR